MPQVSQTVRPSPAAFRADPLQIEGAGRVVPEDFPLAGVWNLLIDHSADSPWEGAVGVRIVCVPQEIVVADQLDCRLHGRFVATKGNEEVGFEIVRGPAGEIFVLGVTAVVPVLLHPLQPVGTHPASASTWTTRSFGYFSSTPYQISPAIAAIASKGCDRIWPLTWVSMRSPNDSTEAEAESCVEIGRPSFSTSPHSGR